jgi:methionyl-tRNA formyltransferase
MRIVVATGIDRMAQHFAATLIRRFGDQVVGVVFQRPPRGEIQWRKKSPLRRAWRYAARHGFSPVRIWRDRRFVKLMQQNEPDAAATRRQLFPVDEAALRGHAGAMWTTCDIHQAETVEAIRALEPDVICTLGGAVLRREILGIPPQGVINIHTGRIPDARGARTTEWAILNDDLDSLAVTVHFIEAHVDRVQVVAQETVRIEADDDEVRIECKLIHAGIERVCDTLLRMTFNSRVRTRPMTGVGGPAHRRRWSREQYVKLRHKISSGAIRRYVQSKQTTIDRASDPQRRAVPRPEQLLQVAQRS